MSSEFIKKLQNSIPWKSNLKIKTGVMWLQIGVPWCHVAVKSGYLGVCCLQIRVPRCLVPSNQDTSVSCAFKSGYLGVLCLQIRVPRCHVAIKSGYLGVMWLQKIIMKHQPEENILWGTIWPGIFVFCLLQKHHFWHIHENDPQSEILGTSVSATAKTVSLSIFRFSLSRWQRNSEKLMSVCVPPAHVLTCLRAAFGYSVILRNCTFGGARGGAHDPQIKNLTSDLESAPRKTPGCFFSFCLYAALHIIAQ